MTDLRVRVGGYGRSAIPTLGDEVQGFTNVTPGDADITTGTNNFGASGHPVVHPTSTNKVYIGYDTQGIWESVDYGRTFTKVSSDLLGAIWFLAIAPDGSYMIAGQGHVFDNERHLRIWKSTDLGRSWFIGSDVLAFQPYGCSIDPTNKDRAIFTSHSGGDGNVWLASNMTLNTGAITCSSIGDTSASNSGYAYFTEDGNTVIHVADGDGSGSGQTRRNTWNGSSWSGWTGVTVNQHYHGSHMLFVDSINHHLWNPGPAGVYKSTDNGANWTQKSSVTSASCARHANFMMAGRSYATMGTFDPKLQTSTDGGDTWAEISEPSGMDNGPRAMCVTTNASGQGIIIMNCWRSGTFRYVV